MKPLYVKHWMTPNPITISPKTTLPEALQIMLENHIRRLPVTWQGDLIGIVTFGDIREAKPSEASSLSVYELNFLLDQLTVKHIMTPDPICVSPHDSVRKAARIMLKKKVGGLPVVENDRLVGIITETDFCRLLSKVNPLARQPRMAAAVT